MGETLDDLVDLRGLSLTDLAERSGLTPRAIYMLRMGQVARPRSTTVAKLAKALRVSPRRMRAALQQQVAAA